jgi:hypothetical protein
MIETVVKLATMPDIKEYVTILKAAEDERVPYTAYWLRRLCQDGKIKALKIGSAEKGQWLIHLPTLLEYVKQMNELGTQKHTSQN